MTEVGVKIEPKPWHSALPPELRTKHVHSWCPFCYLGWAPLGRRHCIIALPTGNVDCHVPAIEFDRETPMHKIMGMFAPRPWERRQMEALNINWMTQWREIPGLAQALERDANIRQAMKVGGLTRELATQVWDATRAAAAVAAIYDVPGPMSIAQSDA